ncbi:hypothetical protein [Actinocorallia populi]|uniref:hypothetical protein n=1 Tax=Actinocorallia populi TaxID=2079200 RepID=UPI000D08B487|nr:hypothetical protein [Actinocorallia populi]
MTNNRQQAADDHTEQIARDLYEGVRQLNHATAGPPGLTYPGTVYTVLGNLAVAVYGLEQSLRQLHRFLGEELDAGRLGHDLGHSPDSDVHRAQEALFAAGAMTRKLATTLGRAQNAIRAINAEPELNPVRLASQAFPMTVEEAVRMPFPGDTDKGRKPQARDVQARKEA